MNNNHLLKGDTWIDAPTVIEAEHREKLNKIMSKKYVIKNCPAGQIVTSVLDIKKIENVFTLRHLIIAKLVAKGYSNRAIINKIHYSIGVVSKSLKDFYTRYEILGNNHFKRKKLFLILQAKLKQNT